MYVLPLIGFIDYLYQKVLFLSNFAWSWFAETKTMTFMTVYHWPKMIIMLWWKFVIVKPKLYLPSKVAIAEAAHDQSGTFLSFRISFEKVRVFRFCQGWSPEGWFSGLKISRTAKNTLRASALWWLVASNGHLSFRLRLWKILFVGVKVWKLCLHCDNFQLSFLFLFHRSCCWGGRIGWLGWNIVVCVFHRWFCLFSSESRGWLRQVVLLVSLGWRTPEPYFSGDCSVLFNDSLGDVNCPILPSLRLYTAFSSPISVRVILRRKVI